MTASKLMSHLQGVGRMETRSEGLTDNLLFLSERLEKRKIKKRLTNHTLKMEREKIKNQ